MASKMVGCLFFVSLNEGRWGESGWHSSHRTPDWLGLGNWEKGVIWEIKSHGLFGRL